MVPDYQACMLPLLSLLGDEREHSLRDCVEKLSQQMNLSSEELAELLPSGKQPKFSNRVGWAKFYLEKAELVKTVSRGKYKITKQGIELLSQNPKSVNNETLVKYEAYRKFIGQSYGGSSEPIINSSETSTPEELLDLTFNKLQRNLAEEILEKVLQQPPYFFEKLVVELLVQMGYGAGKITGRSGDEGIDGVINEDKLGLEVIHIQAKRWQKGNNVGRKELQSFVGALAGQSGRKGVFITTSSFTREAIEYNPSNVKIAKIDGEKLSELMITYNLGVSSKMLYELKKVDTDYFDE